jgi:hypothetical protein
MMTSKRRGSIIGLIALVALTFAVLACSVPTPGSPEPSVVATVTPTLRLTATPSPSTALPGPVSTRTVVAFTLSPVFTPLLPTATLEPA